MAAGDNIDIDPELEELCKKYVVREDGSRPSFALCIMAQKFTEDKSRGYMGAYSRQAHADLTGPDGPLPPKLFKGARRLRRVALNEDLMASISVRRSVA